MYRFAINKLISWKNKANRKPLLIQGARQVGKTWLMREFGKLNYQYVAYISFNDNEEVKKIFEQSYHVETIIKSLEIITNTTIIPSETLIIFDEIQECAKALNALKFFNENAPEYNIVAAGSLLGVALKHKQISFPVGQVEFLELRPLSFIEFLYALDETKLADALNEAQNIALIDILHDKLCSYLRTYLYVGGMPEAVKFYIANKDLKEVREIQKQILLGYQSDFSKHINASNITKVQAIWDSIPYQLAKENKKFAYNKVAKGARAREYEEAIEWLRLCGLIYRVHRISKPHVPLASYEESSAFKLYMLDCGLLNAKADLDAYSVLDGNTIFTEFKGSLTEQFVLQELKAHEDLAMAYWASETASAEVDFVIQYNKQIVPIEVKATINLKARSLKSYQEQYKQKLAIRTSLANFKENNQLYDIPLYLIGKIRKIVG